MAAPLKVILIIAAICSGMYVFSFVRNVIYTGQFNIDKLLWIFGSFIGITVFGLLIWGLAALAQWVARRKRASRLKVTNPRISTMQ